VQAVLAARIDRLPPEDKRLLQTAAVIGTEVPLLLLHHIAEVPEDALHRGLAHLQGAEFLYETRLFPEQVYTFKHALTHEVAYNGLLQERRRGLHARIVAALEGLYAERLDEQVERLAHHALRGEMWDKACTYSRQAGAKAMGQSAYRAVVVAYEQALEALEHLPQEHETLVQVVDLHLALHPPFVALNANEAILSHLHTAERLATALNDPRRLALIYAGLVAPYRATSNTERALLYSQRCHALATTSGDMALQIVADQRLGQLYYDLGDYQQAITAFRRNVMSLQGTLRYQRFGTSTASALPAMVALTYLAWCLAELGAFAEGFAYGDEALRLVEGLDSHYDQVVAQYRVGRFHLRQGNLARAIPLLERALALSQAAEVRSFISDNAAALAVAYALAGRVAETAPLLEYTPRRTYEVLRASEAYLLVGRVADARQWAQRALAHARDQHEQGHHAHALWLLGEIARHGDAPEIESATTHYQGALTLAVALGMRPLQAHCHSGLGTLSSQAAQPERARAELHTAIALYREMAMTFWLPQAEAALAQVEGE
jgi:tetratricopeptide (TPR) repeat protein